MKTAGLAAAVALLLGLAGGFALGLHFSQRYTVAPVSGTVFLRLDRFTGKTEMISANGQVLGDVAGPSH